MRQLAYLQAVPKPPPGSRRVKQADQAPQPSRAEQMKQAGIVPKMPPNPLPHIVERLIEIGLTEAAGMGLAPLSWREINEWQRATSVTLAPWEARLIRQLSVEYLTESRRAESENCPPPWRGVITDADRSAEERQLRSVLG